MSFPSTTTVPRISADAPLGGWLLRFLVAAGIAALLAGLGAAYFAVNAGADYPEPTLQASD